MECSNFISSETLTPAQEAHYLTRYLPLVKRVVKQLAWQTQSVIDSEDMEQIALMGLLSSLRRYGAPDEQFASYAYSRVRRAVLDELGCSTGVLDVCDRKRTSLMTPSGS